MDWKKFIHADNCSGQNKNNLMIAYLTWRVMMGYYKITFAGYIKLSSDSFFWAKSEVDN